MGTADFLRREFEAAVDRSERHGRGAYWTPDRTAELLIDAAGYDGDPGRRVVDPACGGGALLCAAARRMLARGASRSQAARALAGVDIDPRAIAAARQTLGALLGPVDLEIALADALGEPPIAPGQLVLTNPPWIRFADLPRAVRDATRPLWQHYGLFSLDAKAARLGGGDKDLALLFTLVAADRYLVPGGTLATFVTLDVLKSKGAGEGFRRFRLPSGEPLGPLSVHDLRAIHAFPGATGKAGILVLERGRTLSFPVPWFIHAPVGAPRLTQARPAQDRPSAPWRVGDAPALRRPTDGPAAYRAHVGARVEPYGVYWLRVLAEDPRGGRLWVENLPELGKRAVPRVRMEIEPTFVRPALRGRDIREGRAHPTLWALLLSDPEARRPIDEAELRASAPLTYSYLECFRDLLASRGSRMVRDFAARTAFYAQFGIGPYTVAPHQVVWNRMGRKLRPAPSGAPILPTDTCALIACASTWEARYLVTLLDTHAVQEALGCSSDPGRGFASPGAIAELWLPRFDPSLKRHQAIAAGDGAEAEALLERR